MIRTLRQKHPDAKPSNDIMMLHGPFNHVNEIIFDGTNADLVRKCAIRTKSSRGASGLDVDFCSKILCNSRFGNTSDDLCHAIALFARMLCSEELVDPKSIEGLVACRLIPLDKSPGVRPIGGGEVLRCIIGKAILTVLKLDILNVTGYQQLCAALESGCEVAVHAVVDHFKEDTSHGFIQIDASNAFNSINRTLILHNVRILFPEIATYINDCYMKPSRLFITGGKEISLNDGTTHGDPIATAMYALGLMLLISSIISNNTGNLIHVAFADDLTGVGKIHELTEWWKNLLHYGPYLGYYVNESKSWLIIKEESKQRKSERNIPRL